MIISFITGRDFGVYVNAENVEVLDGFALDAYLQKCVGKSKICEVIVFLSYLSKILLFQTSPAREPHEKYLLGIFF